MASSGSSMENLMEESQVGEACLAPIRICVYIYIHICICCIYIYLHAVNIHMYIYKYVPRCLYSASKYMNVRK